MTAPQRKPYRKPADPKIVGTVDSAEVKPGTGVDGPSYASAAPT